MQTLIVALLLITACIYLTWRWMPKMRKQSVQAWLNRHMPRLAHFTATSKGGCGGGCSSCNQCETPVVPAASTSDKRIIAIHQR